MKSSVSKGIICLKDELNIEFRVCVIEYILNEDETFEYRFYPNYEVISLLSDNLFQGIPGLNLDLKKEVYIRKNILPVFISERVPSKNREDYFELLEKVNMTYMDPIEFLIRSKERYSGDHFYLIRHEESKRIDIEEIKGKVNAFGLTKTILQEMAANNSVYLNETRINDQKVFDTLHYLYNKQYLLLKDKQKEGIALAKNHGQYKGRKEIYVDIMAFYETLEKVHRKELTNKQAAEKLGISIDKYYRVKKKLQNKNDTLLQINIIDK